jgi:hypothetical protein
MAPLLDAIRAASAESEAHRARIATLMGDYLQARRTAYSLKQWKRGADGYYGPVEGEVLEAVGRMLLQRLSELVTFLQAEQGPLQVLRDQYLAASERLNRLAPGDDVRRAQIADELIKVDKASRQTSDAVHQGLLLYHHYLAAIRRIGGLDSGLVPARQIEPLSPRVVRKLLTLVAQPMR